jgi:hypothetical protein
MEASDSIETLLLIYQLRILEYRNIEFIWWFKQTETISGM